MSHPATRLVPRRLASAINGAGYRSASDADRTTFVAALVSRLAGYDRPAQFEMVEQFSRADTDLGRRIAEGLGLRAQRLAA